MASRGGGRGEQAMPRGAPRRQALLDHDCDTACGARDRPSDGPWGEAAARGVGSSADEVRAHTLLFLRERGGSMRRGATRFPLPFDVMYWVRNEALLEV